MSDVFFFQAEDGIRDGHVTGVQTLLFRSGAGAVELTAESASKGLAQAKIEGTGNDLRLKIDYTTKAPGAYPIILVTYELVCSKGQPADKVALLKSFLGFYVSADGQSILNGLSYGPLPEELRAKVDAAVQSIS